MEAFDVLGRRVAVLLDEPLGPGVSLPLTFPTGTVSAGPYVVRAVSADGVATRRIVVQ